MLVDSINGFLNVATFMRKCQNMQKERAEY